MKDEEIIRKYRVKQGGIPTVVLKRIMIKITATY